MKMDKTLSKQKRMWVNGTVFLVLGVAVLNSATVLKLCQIQSTSSKTIAYFNMNGEPLQTIQYMTTISGTDDNECQINTTDMVANMSFSGTSFYAVLLHCQQRQTIHFSDYNATRNDEAILHVEIANCTFDISSLNTLMNIADTRVFGAMIDIDQTGNTPLEDAFQKLVTFIWVGLLNHEQKLSNILNRNVIYTELAEIHLENVTLDINWNDIKKMLPNLQSLEIPNSNMQIPPSFFPWTDSFVKLPRHLSRSQIMESHYSSSEYVVVPSHLFRRYFNLAGNKIKDLRNYTFHGILHKISLTNNGLETFKKDTFTNVQGLQNLDLSNNKLLHLPQGAFMNLDRLRKLDLSSNKLTYLPLNIFDDLTALEKLDLANNSIESLPDRILVRLTNLEHLRLEHNRILYMNPSAFPLQSIKLKEVHFSYNPLTTLPHFPFQIRGLQVANFRGTNITINNLTKFLEDANYLSIAESVIDSASDTDVSDLLQRPDTLRKIDLSHCNITNVELVDVKTLPANLRKLLLILLLHFEFVLSGNPIKCNCRNNNFIRFVNANTDKGSLSRNEYFYKNWVCQAPTELINRKFLSVKPIETYCKVTVKNCPSECECYERSVVSDTIVDCRDKNLSHIHDTLPEGKLELWYSGNDIVSFTNIGVPANIVSVDLSSNKLERIDAELIKKMINLKEVRLQSNVLAYLPKSIEALPLKKAEIWPNPFTCDCNSLWMKKWLMSHQSIITEWEKVTCKVENEDGMKFTLTPDEKFICDTPFNELRYVIMPSIVSSSVVIIVAICAVLIYAYRLECKVLLFVYFGFHPFDKDSENLDEKIDCVIVHSGKQTDWVMERIVSLLESESYLFVVCDMARDFVIGYSFQENLTRTVRHSKRIIFCVSPDWNKTADSFKIAWRIAQEKIKDIKSHYAIVVAHEINANEVGDKDMKRLIKQGRYVNSSEKLFGNKIVYYMPIRTNQLHTGSVHFKPSGRNSEYVSQYFKSSLTSVSGKLPEFSAGSADMYDAFAPVKGSHVYISYHDDDFEYVMAQLVPLLESMSYTYCISDRDFVPGASKEENILNAINGSGKTLFVMSKAHICDEWSLFAFRTAYEKSLREKSNHLIVLVKETVDNDIEDEEMRYYVKNYICLNINDRWFEKKLINGLPRLKEKNDSRMSIHKTEPEEAVGVDNVIMEIE